MDGTNQQKPTLRSLCLQHKVTIFELERASNVNYVVIWGVFVGLDTSREVVTQLLDGLNEIRSTTYTLNDINVNLGEGKLYVL